jgi:hypothetical protein
MRLLVLTLAFVGAIQDIHPVSKKALFSFVQFGSGGKSEVTFRVDKASSGDELTDDEQTTGQEWAKLTKGSSLVKLGYDHWTASDNGFRFKDSNKKKVLDCAFSRGSSEDKDVELSFSCSPQKDYESLMETESPCWKPVSDGCPYGADYIWGNWVKSQKFYTVKKKAFYGCSKVQDDKCVGAQTCFPIGAFHRYDLQPNPTSQYPVNQPGPVADKSSIDRASKAASEKADELKKAAAKAQETADNYKKGKEEGTSAPKGTSEPKEQPTGDF